MRGDRESESGLLDELLRDAREAAIEEGPDDDALVGRAALAGRARHEARARRGTLMVAIGSLALAAAVALGWLVPASEAERPVGEIVELTLPAGDRLAATGDARFDVVSSGELLRVVRLRRGAMLFDVAPLGSGSAFEVETPDARVRVRGTVFAVEVGEGGTGVRVYEGRVELERDGETPVVLEAGAADGVPRDGSERLTHLDARGRAAGAMRAFRASVPLEPSALEAIEPVAPPGGDEASEATPIRRRRSSGAVAEVLEPPRSVTPSEGRELLLEGRSEEALAVAQLRAGDDPAWRLVEADALRGLGRSAEAADAYEDAAHRLDGVAASAPAFLAAELRMRRLHDPIGALRVLDETGIDTAGSPLQERGLALRADALDQLGRTEELARVAEIYLGALPAGPRAEWMRSHIAPSSP